MPSRAASTDAPMARAMKARALALARALSAPVRKELRPRKTARGTVFRAVRRAERKLR